MSNTANINSISSGFIIYDNYEAIFVQCENADGIDDAIEIIQVCLRGVKGSDILQFCQEMEKGISINDTWYDYDEISSAFEE